MTKTPRPYQQDAIDNVIKGFQDHSRGQMIMPCGTGKTLISLWIYEALKSKRTIILFPSLSLLRQTKNEWVENSKEAFKYLCVCSDQGVDQGLDAIKIDLKELSNVTTDPKEIRSFLKKNPEGIIFSTYQSLDTIIDAIRRTDIIFDLAICDEAHKTAGKAGSKFSLIHDDSSIKCSKRLYMTATPRVLNASNSETDQFAYCMDNPQIFGPEFHRMNFREAINQGILVDYKIIAVHLTDEIIKKIDIEDKDSSQLLHNHSLKTFLEKYNAHHIVTYHSSIKRAKEFSERHNKINKDIKSFHIYGAQGPKVREEILNQFATLETAIISNARCLIEGVDVPVIDAVFFSDDKSSRIDVVQAIGRALRTTKDGKKDCAYIILPFYQSSNEEVIDEDNKFKNIINIVKALYSVDERIVDFIKTSNSSGDNKKALLNLEVISNKPNALQSIAFTEKNLNSIKDQIILKTLEYIRPEWRPFEEAREFARSLKLKSFREWYPYAKTSFKPRYIPASPHLVYKNEWIGWRDWLGTQKTYNFLNFQDAKKYIHSLKLRNTAEFFSLKRDKIIPLNIPRHAHLVYKNEWIDWKDWLGIPKKFYTYEEAIKIIHPLKINSIREFRKKTLNFKKIPRLPNQHYKNKGWISWSAFLGSAKIRIRRRDFLSLNKAKKIVHKLKIKSSQEWLITYKNLELGRLYRIPYCPSVYYRNKGWISWEDFLGPSYNPKSGQYSRTPNNTKDFESVNSDSKTPLSTKGKKGKNDE